LEPAGIETQKPRLPLGNDHKSLGRVPINSANFWRALRRLGSYAEQAGFRDRRSYLALGFLAGFTMAAHMAARRRSSVRSASYSFLADAASAWL